MAATQPPPRGDMGAERQRDAPLSEDVLEHIALDGTEAIVLAVSVFRKNDRVSRRLYQLRLLFPTARTFHTQ